MRSSKERRRLELLRQLVRIKPETPEELWLYFKHAFGIELTRRAVCSGHSSQLDFAWAIISGEVPNIIARATRHGGKTTIAAATALIKCITTPGIEGFVMSGCLAPWTMVPVRRRQRLLVLPIAKVEKGDLVWTLQGWRRVVGKGVTEVENFLALRLPCGRLSLTADHKIWTLNAGELRGRWVPAAEINRASGIWVPLAHAAERLLPGDEYPTINPELAGALAFASRRETDDKIQFLFITRSSSQKRPLSLLTLKVQRFIALLEEHLGVKPLRLSETERRGNDPDRATYQITLLYRRRAFPPFYLNQDISRYWRFPAEWRHRFATTALYHASQYFGVTFSAENLYTLAINASYTVPAIHSPESKRFGTLVSLGILWFLLFDFVEADFSGVSGKPFWFPVAADPRLTARTKDPIKPDFVRSSSAVVNNAVTQFPLAAKPSVLDFSWWERSTKKLASFKPNLFIDLTIEDTDNFMVLPGVIVHNSKRQAKRFYQFFEAAYLKPHFQDEFDGPPQKEEIRFKTGSRIEILATSDQSARSPHGNLIIADEVDTMPARVFDALSFAVDLATDENVPFIITSTQHRYGGNMERLIEKIESASGQIRLFSWCMRDVIAPCPPNINCREIARDKNGKPIECPLLPDCGGVAKLKKEGFLRRDQLIALKARLASSEVWDVEVMLKRPAGEDEPAFAGFRDSFPYVQTFEPRRGLPALRGFDFGTHLGVVWAQFDAENLRLWVLHEELFERVPYDEIARRVIEIDTRYRISVRQSWGDPHGVQDIINFRNLGIPIHSYAGRRKLTRIRSLAYFLEPRDSGMPGLIIHSRCRRLREEIARATFQELITYDPRTGKRLHTKEGYHLLDALIYLADGVFMTTVEMSKRLTIFRSPVQRHRPRPHARVEPSTPHSLPRLASLIDDEFILDPDRDLP